MLLTTLRQQSLRGLRVFAAPAMATLATATIAALAFAVGAFLYLEQDRENALANAEREMQRLTIVLAEQVRQAITAAQLVLDAVAEDAAAMGNETPEDFAVRMSTREVHNRLTDRVRGVPQVDVAAVLDSRGNPLNSSRSYPPAPVNLADRDHFIVHANGTQVGMFVSTPVKNRTTGEWTFFLSRGIRSRSGQFLGTITTGMRSAFFSDFFERVKIGDQAALSLFRDDGILIARYPQIDEAMGRSFSNATSFRILRLQPAGGVMRTGGPRTADPADSAARIVAPRPVPSLPLVINLTDTQDEILTAWHLRSQLVTAGAAFAVILLLALGVIAYRLLAGRERLLAESLKAKATAEEALQAKSRFLAAMSHEIRTPMNAVLGMAGVLMESRLSPEQHDQIRLIRDSGDLLLKLINEILDLSKLEAGKVEIEHIAFDPRALTHDTAQIMMPRAMAKGLTIDVQVAADLPDALLGDPSRIRQILFNLVGNAVKFTDRGRIAIVASLAGRDGGMATVQWSVSDSGIGIAPDKIDALFADFVQADTSISRRFGGTGLGLSISKRLVDLMRGAIAVDSQPGAGTTVRFTLPLPVTQPLPVQSAAQSSGNESDRLNAALAQRPRPVRVLVVEDNSTNQLVAQALLRRPGLSLDFASNGVEAIETIARHSYDIVLMDVQMPEMDGLTATRMVRRRGGRFAEMPIIAFTANAFAEEIAQCREAGMNDYVVKPVRKDALLGAILRNLSAVPPPDIAAQTEETAVGQSPIAMLVEDLGEEGAAGAIATFIKSTSTTLPALPALLAEPERLLREVHSIKGAAGMVGAEALAKAAAAQEARLKSGGALEPRDIAALQAAFDVYKNLPDVLKLLHRPAAA
jgi:signal transduction histidine kinase/DNA-binding response OmpR family regulator